MYEKLTADEWDKRLKQKEKPMVDIADIDEELPVQPDRVEDLKKTAVKMAFIGIGQGGCNLADAFYSLGYRCVLALNTTAKDLQRLTLPEGNRMILQGSAEGAGKTPAVGAKVMSENYEDVMSRLNQVFKKGIEQILICVGGGGGTGTGGALGAVKVAQEFLASQQVANPAKKVGVIYTLPTRDESSAVQQNALETLLQLTDLADKGQLSPLVIVDNAKVMALYGQASVSTVWAKANKNIAALFDVFNTIPAVEDDTCLVTFDPADYRTVLASGILAFGRTKLDRVNSPTAIADAVRQNVKKGLLVDGLELSQATTGAGILIADRASLDKIPQEALEGAFGSLNRLMKQSPETKLHRGVYATANPGIHLYTLIGGLGRPVERMKEMEAKAGKAYPIT